MNKFKVGDRVSIYGYIYQGLYCQGFKGIIVSLSGYQASVTLDKYYVAETNPSIIHIKQCRKLKSKNKLERFKDFIILHMKQNTHDIQTLGDIEEGYQEFLEMSKEK